MSTRRNPRTSAASSHCRRSILALAVSLAISGIIPGTLTAQFQYSIDFGDVPVGTEQPRVFGLKSLEVHRTMICTIEGSSQFTFSDERVFVPAKQSLVTTNVEFRPTRLGRDSAIAVATDEGNPSDSDRLRLYGRGVEASAANESALASGVRIRRVERSPTAIVDMTLQRPGRVRISLWSVDGGLVATPVDEVAASGNQTFLVALWSLAAGAYLCRIETGEGAWTTVLRR